MEGFCNTDQLVLQNAEGFCNTDQLVLQNTEGFCNTDQLVLQNTDRSTGFAKHRRVLQPTPIYFTNTDRIALQRTLNGFAPEIIERSHCDL